jgi:hypothetical protein
MRITRIHLSTLFACMIAAAILLGLNAKPRLLNVSTPRNNDMLSCHDLGLPPHLLTPPIYSRQVSVTQGWPLRYHIEETVVSVRGGLPPEEISLYYEPELTNWSWSSEAKWSWPRFWLNVGIALVFLCALMFTLEYKLHKKSIHS